MPSGIICQGCGIEAPTRHVIFLQNIGMLVMRTHRKINGMMCKNCVHKHFWKMTTTTLFLGPWGYISIIVSPFFILNNLVRYLGCLGMPAVPPGASVPILTDKAIAQLRPFAGTIADRLNTNEQLVDVANDIARRARVTPGQVVKYVIALSQQNRQQPRTGGFPVVQNKPMPVLPIEADADEEIANAEFDEESAD
jgi:hypothetical protein